MKTSIRSIQANGSADLGAALKELNSMPSRKDFLVSEMGYYKPVIIFMSDGHPTDDWRKALEDTNKNNKWFQRAIGDDADANVLLKLVGNIEAIVKGIDMETLMWLMGVFRFRYWKEDDLPCIAPDTDRGDQNIKTGINSGDDWNDIDWE